LKEKPLFVWAFVGYVVAEVVLMMLTTVPFGEEANFTGAFRVSVWIGQLLLVPGLAVLTSRLLTGPYHWRRPLVGHILPGLLLPAAFLPFLVTMFPLARLNAPNLIIAIAVILTFVLEVVLAFCLMRRMARRNRQFEAERWINDRNAVSDSRRRSRTIRKLLWLPSMLVLLLFLFFPEVWGSMWHVANRKATLQGYRVPLPLTWFVLYNNEPSTHLSGMAGTGIARGWKLHHYLYVPLSDWTVSENSEENQLPGWLENEQVTSTRVFRIDKQTLTCNEYQRKLPVWWTAAPTQPIYVDCRGDGLLRATLNGEKSHLPAFYQMISGITPSN
jgi:hypothetical protein